MNDAYLRGVDRSEEQLLPPRVEDFVDENNPVRVVDAFVDGMSYGACAGALPEERQMDDNGGRRGYPPSAMAKLFIWGYLNHIRSTRRLEKECTRNTELMWLINGLRPDHTSISRFRSTHAKRIATWLKEFNLIASAAGLLGGKELVIDGTLLKAVNAKKNNYTSIKISRTLEKIQKNIDDYLERLKKSESSGCDEDRVHVDDLKQKLSAFQEARKRYKELEAQARESPTGQVSLTDPEAVMLKKKPGANAAVVGYNAQSVVDSEHHLIAAVKVDNSTHDFGHLDEMAQAAMENIGNENKTQERVKVLADAGYRNFADIHAIQSKGFEAHIAIGNKREKRGEFFPTTDFRYDIERDLYHCPGGHELTAHATSLFRGRRSVGYYNVGACSGCELRAKCTSGRYRKINRDEYQHAIDQMKRDMSADPGAYARRAATVEHPFGTMLFWRGARALMCRGIEKANAEFGLSALAYNITRTIKLLGVPCMVEMLRTRSCGMQSV